VARSLSDGRWTHDYPITLEKAKSMGLPVTDEGPLEIYTLMDLYTRRASAGRQVKTITSKELKMIKRLVPGIVIQLVFLPFLVQVSEKISENNRIED
jgi:hypothetical protein